MPANSSSSERGALSSALAQSPGALTSGPGRWEVGGGLGPRRDKGAPLLQHPSHQERPPGARPLGSRSCRLSERRCSGARRHFSTSLLLNFSLNLTRGAHVPGGTAGPPSNLRRLGPYPMRPSYTPISVIRDSHYAAVGALGAVGVGFNHALKLCGFVCFRISS